MNILPTRRPSGSDWPIFPEESVDRELGELSSPGRVKEPRIVRARLAKEANDHLQRLEDHYHAQRGAYVERLRVQDVRTDIHQAQDRAIDRLQALANQEKAAVDASRNDYERKSRDYDLFRKQNAISREPHYPEDRLRHVLLAIIALVVESVFNASLLAIGLEGGLLAGGLISMTIACLNVGGAFVFGNIARQVNDRRWPHRVFGYVNIALAVLVLLALNLLVAHYREAINVAASQGYEQILAAGRSALESFRENYFGVSDFMSWTLFGMGVLSAALGAWKGYTLEDPYPGYSRRARALKLAESDFHDEVGEVQEEITRIQESATQQIDALSDQYRDKVAEAESVRNSIPALNQRYHSEIKKLRGAIDLLHNTHCPSEDEIEISVPANDEPTPDIVAPDLGDVEAKRTGARGVVSEKVEATTALLLSEPVAGNGGV